MQFTPLTQYDLKAGQALPWNLYNTAGDIILKAGAITKTSEQINSLIKIGAMIDLNEQAAKAKADAESVAARAANVTTLEQIKLNIGDTLQLQFQSESENSRCSVTLIGYLSNYGVIVSTPVLNGSIMLIREGQIFVVRLFSGKSAYAFTSTTMKVTNTPYPHLHLSYPKEVRGLVIRGSSRARANIICHATTKDGNGYACVARDISTGGALIAVGKLIGEIGDSLTLDLRVKVNGTEHMLSLNCQIRSANPTRSGGEEHPTILHGLSFDGLSSQDTLVISALLYQNMVNELVSDA